MADSLAWWANLTCDYAYCDFCLDTWLKALLPFDEVSLSIMPVPCFES